MGNVESHYLLESFLSTAESRLRWWFDLANIYDSYGLPVDIIYLKCRDSNCLPFILEKIKDNFGNECWKDRPCTSQEFEDGIEFCVKVRQVGGLDFFLNHLAAAFTQ